MFCCGFLRVVGTILGTVPPLGAVKNGDGLVRRKCPWPARRATILIPVFCGTITARDECDTRANKVSCRRVEWYEGSRASSLDEARLASGRQPDWHDTMLQAPEPLPN